MAKNVISKTREKLISVREIESEVEDLLRRAEAGEFYYKILLDNKPLGVLVPYTMWDELLEDLEMYSSSNFLKSIREARKSKVFYTPEQIKKGTTLNSGGICLIDGGIT